MSNEENKEEQKSSSTGIPIFDFIFGLLDRIFKDGATGKLLISRVAVLVILFSMGFFWVKSDHLMIAYKNSRYETYAEVLQKEKDEKYDKAIIEQLQIVHVSSSADFSAIYAFRPKNFNYFVDLVAYEGKLPETVDSRNLGGFPIDKTSNEYSTHLTGTYFTTENEFKYLPTTNKEITYNYMFSCPYFNLDNVYSGTIAMYWKDKPDYTDYKLNAICGQAARVIGRSR